MVLLMTWRNQWHMWWPCLDWLENTKPQSQIAGNDPGGSRFGTIQRHLKELPSGDQTWLAGKSLINGGFKRKLTDKWSIFHCHVWLPEGMIKGSLCTERLYLELRSYCFQCNQLFSMQPLSRKNTTRMWVCLEIGYPNFPDKPKHDITNYTHNVYTYISHKITTVIVSYMPISYHVLWYLNGSLRNLPLKSAHQKSIQLPFCDSICGSQGSVS